MRYRIVATVAIASIIVASAFYITVLDKQFGKTYNESFAPQYYVTSVSPFNNTSGTLYTLNFSIHDYSGGPIKFSPIISVNSSVNPFNSSETLRLSNLTYSTANNTSTTPYGTLFYLRVIINPIDGTPGAGSYSYYSMQTGSFGYGGPSILWGGSANGYTSIPMSPVNIPGGTYNVTVNLNYVSTEPSQSYLDLSSGWSHVILKGLTVSSSTTLFSSIGVQDLSVDVIGQS